jgi:putative ABC transport system ATP-binding protein
MTQPLIEAIDVVQRLGKGAGQVRALKGVNLALGGGQLTLLMGPSGSGKTTLLSVLGCMLTPTEGTVRIRGRDVTAARPGELAKLRRDHIGFIFQSYRLFPTLTALDNVRLALDVRGERSVDAIDKARDVLLTVGLSHKENAFPSELSGGEQQRVAIARAIVGNPAAILADEPTGALDSENGLAIMKILGQIARDPDRAVLVVTHDPRIVPFADRIIHIEDGCIDADAPRIAVPWPEEAEPALNGDPFPPRFLHEAQDFEQHRGAVERGDRARVE